MMSQLYNKQYFQDRFEGQKSMAFILSEFLKSKKVKTVLDVGCGSGWMINYLKKYGFEMKGVDISYEALKISKQIKASATKLPFKDEAFDAVISISLIEHLIPKEVDKFLLESRRVLNKKGWLFLVTPNLSTPLRRVQGKKWGGYADPTHINLYTPNKLRKLLKSFNFNNFQLTFPYSPKIPQDLGFPKKFERLPKTLRNFFYYLVISSPLHYLKHSFWIAAKKI